MAAMKRLVLPFLVVAFLASSAALLPGVAHAASPCRDRIYNDWYRDGKIASSYPLACYRDAIKHVPSDAAIYSSLQDDIRSALQAAIARSHGSTVPTEVGSGLPTSDASDVMSTTAVETVKRASSSANTSTTSPTDQQNESSTQQQVVAAPVASTSSSSGLPVPILVLGALALLLAGVGAVGAGVRHFRR
jgi:cobalamin biosynthesis Mg chelatase CobN